MRPCEVSDIPLNFQCPITGELMCDPVTAADGVTYQRGNIEQYFRANGAISYDKGWPLPSKKLVPNRFLYFYIEHLYPRQQTQKHKLDSVIIDKQYGSEPLLGPAPSAPPAPPRSSRLSDSFSVSSYNRAEGISEIYQQQGVLFQKALERNNRKYPDRQLPEEREAIGRQIREITADMTSTQVLDLLVRYPLDLTEFQAIFNQVLEDAVKKNNIELIKLLLWKNAEATPHLMNFAIENKSKQIVRLLLDFGIEIHGRTDLIELASNVGDVGILILIQKNVDEQPPYEQILQAIQSKDLSILKALLQRGAVIEDVNSCIIKAIESGEVKILTIILDHLNCPPTDGHFLAAIQQKQLSMVKCLLSYQPTAIDSKRLLIEAFKTKDVTLILWIIKNICQHKDFFPTADIMQQSLAVKSSEILKLLMTKGGKIPVIDRGYLEAIIVDYNSRLIKLLLLNNCISQDNYSVYAIIMSALNTKLNALKTQHQELLEHTESWSKMQTDYCGTFLSNFCTMLCLIATPVIIGSACYGNGVYQIDPNNAALMANSSGMSLNCVFFPNENKTNCGWKVSCPETVHTFVDQAANDQCTQGWIENGQRCITVGFWFLVLSGGIFGGLPALMFIADSLRIAFKYYRDRGRKLWDIRQGIAKTKSEFTALVRLFTNHQLIPSPTDLENARRDCPTEQYRAMEKFA